MHFTVAGDGKYKRGRRVVLNAKHKFRDRYKPKLAKWAVPEYLKYRRFRKWARDDYRTFDALAEIREGLEDIAAGRYQKFTSVADLLEGEE